MREVSGATKRWSVTAAIAAGVLVAVLVVADFVVRTVAENSVATSVRKENNTESVDVSFGGVSMLFNLVRGRIPSARIAIHNAEFDGFEYKLVDLALHDLRFQRGLVLGRPGDVEGHGGSARITFSVDELNKRLGPARGLVTFRPTADGLDARIDVPIVGGVDVGVDIDVEAATLIIGLDDVAVRGVGFDLPELPKLRIRLPSVPATTEIVGRSVSGDELTLDIRFGAFTVNPEGEIVSLPTTRPALQALAA